MSRICILGLQNSLVLIALLTSSVQAHFTLQSPVSSREKVAFPNDDRRFWPISGSATLRPISNCLDFPRSNTVANFQSGTSVTLRFEIGDGARHIGLCSAELINLSTSQTQSIGQEQNCISRRDAMTVTLPSTACPNCVIKVKVTAVHMGPDRPEFYDSCMDVNISGSAAPPDSLPNPGSAASPGSPPNTTRQPKQPIPSRPRPRPTRNNVIIPLAPPPSTNESNQTIPCSAIGQSECVDNGLMFRVCEPSGFFVTRKMAPGTKCVSLGSGGMSISAL